MRSMLLATTVLCVVAATARADGTSRCGVQVLGAPAELAATIERRVGELAACGGRLDVWIVRTDGGLTVVARDALGRVRTRRVPDPEVASALIAAWVEMEGRLQGRLQAPGSRLQAEPVVAFPSLEPAARSLEPPSPLADIGDRVVTRRLEPTIGVTAFAGRTTGGMTTGGAVIDVDLWQHDGLSLAAMAVLHRDVASAPGVTTVEQSFFRDAGRWGGAVLAELHRRFGTGRWRLTPSLAFGAGATRHQLLVAETVGAGPVPAALRHETTFGFRVAARLALGVRVAPAVDLEVGAGWMLSSYEAHNGIDPTDHALTAGIGVRYDR